MAMNQDSAPVAGYFRDREAADLCLRELRNCGLLNEQIGVSYADSVILTPANLPGVERVTGQRNSASELDTSIYRDPGGEDQRGPVAAYDRNFDPEAEAKQFQSPAEGVMISVSVDPARRDEVRNILHHYGGRLTDWPDAA